MFFFQTCCSSYQSGEGYQIRTMNSPSKSEQIFSHSLQKISKQLLSKPDSQVIKIQKSSYEQILSTYEGTNKMWLDQQFPPEKESLGYHKGSSQPVSITWRRIMDIVKDPIVYQTSYNILPLNIVDFLNEQDKYRNYPFAYAIATLVERQDILHNIFQGQYSYSKHGMYKLPIKIDGQITQIMLDDYVPTDSHRHPLLSVPTNNLIWLLILQKAWAKVNGGYDKINPNPSQIFKAFSWAPCEETHIKQSNQERQKLWKKIINISNKMYPCACQTLDDQQADFYQSGLISNQIYSLFGAFNFEDESGRFQKIVKLRSFVNQQKSRIQITESDKQLWPDIVDYQKQNQERGLKVNNDGVIYMKFQDFCKYFYKLTTCLYEKNCNYLSQKMMCNFKNGALYKFYAKKQGHYNIQLHQPKQHREQNQQNSQIYRRGTIILIKQQNGITSYVDGVLSLNQKDSLLSCELSPGKYLIFAKLDQNPLNKSQFGHFISISSQNFTEIIPQDRKKYPDILQKAFLTHGQQNKRNRYNNDLMWISYKLFYKQGGYAYIGIGNSEISNKKFIVTFDEKDFSEMNFKLKKPYKRIKGVQTIEVMPGEQKIILARTCNNLNTKSLKFPPPLGIKMEPI